MILYLTSEKLPKLFSTEVIPFYIPTSYVWFQFLHLLTNTCYILCLYSISTYIVEHLSWCETCAWAKGCRGTGPLAVLAEPRGLRHKTVAAGGE